MFRCRQRVTATFVSAIACSVGLSGCGPDPFYVPALALGQLDLILHSVPIERALASGSLTEEQTAKLELIVDVRDYARDVMGLTVGDNFTLYYDSGDSTKTYNVSAAFKDRLEAITWSFPIAGTFPYIGFFDKDRATQEFERLRDGGYDTFMYEVGAYSTLNFLPNPVRSAMLRADDLNLVDTVIHELLHNTVWKPGDTTFGESLATFFGRTGAMAYMEDRFSDTRGSVEFARKRYEDVDRYNVFIFELFDELGDFYSAPGQPDQKIFGREAVFASGRQRFYEEVQPLMNTPEDFDWVADLPVNNAWMLSNFRYNFELDLFQGVFDATGRDWRASVSVFRDAAQADDASTFIRQWLIAPAARVVHADERKGAPSTAESGTHPPCSRPLGSHP